MASEREYKLGAIATTKRNRAKDVDAGLHVLVLKIQDQGIDAQKRADLVLFTERADAEAVSEHVKDGEDDDSTRAAHDAAIARAQRPAMLQNYELKHLHLITAEWRRLVRSGGEEGQQPPDPRVGKVFVAELPVYNGATFIAMFKGEAKVDSISGDMATLVFKRDGSLPLGSNPVTYL